MNNMQLKQAQVSAVIQRVVEAANRMQRRRRPRKFFPDMTAWRMIWSTLRLGWRLLAYTFSRGTRADFLPVARALEDFERIWAEAANAK